MRRFRARRVIPLVVLGLALLAGTVWGVERLHYARRHVSTDNAQIDGHVVPVLARVGGYVEEVRIETRSILLDFYSALLL